MLGYRSKKDSPTKAAVTRRAARRSLSPVTWWLAGMGIVTVLLMIWLMPLSPNSDPSGWLLNLIGISGSFNASTRYAGTLRGGLILPAALALVGMAALASSLKAYRRRVALGVLGHLASAVRLQVPLSPYLYAAAAAEPRGLSRRLRRTAAALAEGRPIGAVLPETAGELPPLVIDRVAAAERSYALGASLGPILDRERRLLAMPRTSGVSTTYALVVILTMLYIGVFVMIFVVPKLAQIFHDFQLKLPWTTQALIDFFYFLERGIDPYRIGVGTILLLAYVLLCRSLARTTRGLFTSRPRVRWFGDWIDRLISIMPVIGRLTRDREAALVCEALAEALRAGRPMPDAIAIATLPSLNAVLRDRMMTWRATVEAGQPIAAAARTAKLPRLMCELLAGTAVTGGADAAGSIEFAGRAYAARSARQAAVVAAVLPVFTTLALAAVVAFMALALSSPMITLIDGLTGGRGR